MSNVISVHFVIVSSSVISVQFVIVSNVIGCAVCNRIVSIVFFGRITIKKTIWEKPFLVSQKMCCVQTFKLNVTCLIQVIICCSHAPTPLPSY